MSGSTALRERLEDEHGDTAQFAARLTAAAYAVALRHGVGARGSFADLELDLWRELRAVVGDPSSAAVRGEAA